MNVIRQFMVDVKFSYFERSYGDGHIERLRTLNRGKALLQFWREMQAKGAADRVCLSHVFKGQLLPEQNVIFVLLNRKSAIGLFSRM